MSSLIISSAIKFIFLFAPFFVITMFLVLTAEETDIQKRNIAIRATISSFIIGVVLFYAGSSLFLVIGITLDSFRIGSGALLFLTAVGLVNNGVRIHAKGLPEEDRDDIAVVPLAIPIIIGPATIGTILVLGAELTTQREMFSGIIGMALALLTVMLSMLLSSHLKRILGKTGLNIMSKISGLILAAMAADIFFTGVQGYLS